MDFSNRNVQSQDLTPGASANPGANLSANLSKSKANNRRDKGKWTRVGVVVLAVAVAVIIIGVICIAVGSNNQKSEDSYVDTTKLQAVFLNTGQVYFGNIKVLNNKYYVLTNIYYLQTSGSSSTASASTSASNVSLVKLGCELHQPYDQMVINTQQVTFWENLQSDGQVAKAVATFQKDNPNGQKCADQSSSSSANSSSNVQSAGSSTPAATSTGSTGTTSTNP
jgi:hypothetical protein